MKGIQISMQNNFEHTLYYDSNCPVCTSFVKLLRKKIPQAKIEYIALENPDDVKEFTYISKGATYSGKEAVDKLAKDFPEVLKYFWMLPPAYRVEATRAIYGVASKIRTIYRKFTGRSCQKCPH
jgi:predicted DCC family thiol-disulfide oxidoreductase YuxK